MEFGLLQRIILGSLASDVRRLCLPDSIKPTTSVLKCVVIIHDDSAGRVIDALALRYCLPTHLDPILANPNIVKVMHGDKAHQLSDWRRRPLPSDMRIAISDTRYLFDIYDQLRLALVDAPTEDVSITTVLDRSKQVCLIRYNKEPFRPAGYRTIMDGNRNGGRCGRGNITSELLDAIKTSSIVASTSTSRDTTNATMTTAGRSREMLSPILGSDALYKQAGWMTPMLTAGNESSHGSSESDDDEGIRQFLDNIANQGYSSTRYSPAIDEETGVMMNNQSSRGSFVDGLGSARVVGESSASIDEQMKVAFYQCWCGSLLPECFANLKEPLLCWCGDECGVYVAWQRYEEATKEE